MATSSDLTVTIRAIDEATPVIKRVRRQLWWYEHGEGVMRAVTVLLVMSAFILGRLS